MGPLISSHCPFAPWGAGIWPILRTTGLSDTKSITQLNEKHGICRLIYVFSGSIRQTTWPLHISLVSHYKPQLAVFPQTTVEGVSRPNRKWTLHLYRQPTRCNNKGRFTHSMPFPCHAVPLIHTCHAPPMLCSDSALSFVNVRMVAGNIRTASPTV